MLIGWQRSNKFVEPLHNLAQHQPSLEIFKEIALLNWSPTWQKCCKTRSLKNARSSYSSINQGSWKGGNKGELCWMLIPRLCTCSLVCSERQKRKAKVLITRALSLMPGSSSHRWLIHLVKNGTLLQQCLAGAAASGPAESAVDALDLLVGSDCGRHPEFFSLIWPFSAQRRDLSCTELDFLRLSVCHWENWNFESPKRNAQVTGPCDRVRFWAISCSWKSFCNRWACPF